MHLRAAQHPDGFRRRVSIKALTEWTIRRDHSHKGAHPLQPLMKHLYEQGGDLRFRRRSGSHDLEERADARHDQSHIRCEQPHLLALAFRAAHRLGTFPFEQGTGFRISQHRHPDKVGQQGALAPKDGINGFW
jgi:hypothetical protein